MGVFAVLNVMSSLLQGLKVGVGGLDAAKKWTNILFVKVKVMF